MKVIAINGSPHKEGNTNLALQALSDELLREGIQTEILHIGGHAIHGCMACGVCYKRKNNQCAIDDLLNDVFEQIADAIVLGTPVYYAGIAGTMKCFCDRLFYVSGANGNRFKGKIGASVVALRRGGASAAFAGLNYYFQMSQMITAGSSYWNSVHGRLPGEAECDTEGLQTMRNLARNIAYLLKLKDEAGGTVRLPEYETAYRTQISDRLYVEAIKK